MNKTTKVLSVAVAMFAIAGMTGVFANQAFANPPGIPQEEKKVYQFMLIGKPGSFEGSCGEGDRIFVTADRKHSHLRIVDGDKWDVTDCNGTGSNTAELTSTDAGLYKIYVDAKGKPGTGLENICVELESDHDHTACLLGLFDIKRDGGKANFHILASELFDASGGALIWSYDVNGNPKIQFRIMQVVP